MKRGVKYFVVVDSYYGEACIYESIESWVKDYMKTYNEKHKGSFDDLIKDLSNKKGPEWAKSYSEKKYRKCEFDGKEELLRAFNNLPYKAESIDVQNFLNLFDPDWLFYEAKFVNYG